MRKNKIKTGVLKLAVALLLSHLTACNFTVSTSSGNITADRLEEVSKSEKKIRNQIHLEKTGVAVETAFLMLDNGDLVADDNIIPIGKKIKLILKLKGWQTTNGTVQLGAGEQLINSEGRLMMRQNDLFKGISNISEEDAKVITLDMEVLNTDTIYDYYQTDFKVWSKTANQYVNGSYRFILKK